MKQTVKIRTSLLAIFLLYCTIHAFSEDISFVGDLKQETTTGYYLLKWQKDNQPASESDLFVLQQSNDRSFTQSKNIYEGPDLASFISGLPNGEYYYRVGLENKAKDITWSKPLQLSVQHHSLQISFILVIAGTIIFLATVAVIVIGNLKYNR